MKYSPLALLIFALSFAAHAKTFSNSFLSFTLPDSWTCVQEGVAWVCSNRGPNLKNGAVIVMAAKVAAPQDNLAFFKDFLSKPKTLITKVGTPMPSSVIYAQERMLAGSKWVQAQHLGGEVQDFYTLYVATVKDKLAILISFSADKVKYAEFNPVFDQAMKSLKLTATNQALFQSYGANGIAVFGIIGNEKGHPDMMPPPLATTGSRSRRPIIWLILGGLALALAGAAYYLYSPKKPKR
jgi:hypothetical protein